MKLMPKAPEPAVQELVLMRLAASTLFLAKRGTIYPDLITGKEEIFLIEFYSRYSSKNVRPAHTGYSMLNSRHFTSYKDKFAGSYSWKSA